ncbi:MAG TPA: hypothetical protein DCR68_01375 [Coprothermobacter sp.]|nr:hypothetical protein [Coprothermobacter sp.]
MFKIELILGKTDVGVVQTLIEGLDNAYSMMGTSRISDGNYRMVLQATSFYLKELISVILSCMLQGNVKSFLVTTWEE